MTLDQITNAAVRRAITGSPTPASEILHGYMDRAPVTDPAALREAELYFAYAGGLRACARAETQFERDNDI